MKRYLPVIMGFLHFLITLTASGCSRHDRNAPTNESASSTPRSTNRGPAAVRLVEAPLGDDVAKIIREATQREKANGRPLVVYVGAPWCEPCQRFHQAVQNGELDTDFANLTLLEFNLDVDQQRLTKAGYTSNLIPLFVVPDADGHPTAARFEGSTKGPTGVERITERLRTLM
ncbi:MAG: thioredoxin family protein [Polyangiaceae bacterium]|nr:thioredoxin family protein [Polyangiaceae bacterium]